MAGKKSDSAENANVAQDTTTNSPEPAVSNDAAQPGNEEQQAGENQPVAENQDAPLVTDEIIPKEIKIKLLDRPPPYRRAGLLFAERENVVDANNLSKEQIERLTRDPALKIEGLE